MLKCDHCNKEFGKECMEIFRVCGTCHPGGLVLVSFKCVKENHPTGSICKVCAEKQGGLKE